MDNHRIWSGYRFQDLGRTAPPIALWNNNTPHPPAPSGSGYRTDCVFISLWVPGARSIFFHAICILLCYADLRVCASYKARPRVKTQLTFQSQCRIYVTQLNNNCRFKHCGCFAKLFGYDLIAWVPPRFPNWTPFQKEFAFKLILVQERG